MPMSEADKARARAHLGYMTVIVATSYAFGLPQLTETQFLLEDAMTRVLDTALDRIVMILDTLDKIECRLGGSIDELFARAIDGLEPNLEQPDMLEREYVRWASRLADLFGVMPYPFSKRFRNVLGAKQIGNVRISG